MEVAEFPQFMSDLQAELEHPQAAPALKKWVEEYVGEIGAGFQSSESQFGQQWAQLKHKRPHGHNPGSRPLIDTGDLMLSVISNASGNIEQIEDDSVVFGTKVPYAIYHQEGTERVPARPFLDVNEDETMRAAELVQEQLMQAIGRG